MSRVKEIFGAEADTHAASNRALDVVSTNGGENKPSTSAPPDRKFPAQVDTPQMTAERQAEYKAWHDAVRDAGKVMLLRLRALPLSELQALMLSADSHLEQWPVYQTGEKRYAMPLWDEEGMTGAQLVALVVFGFWLYYGESEHMVGGSIMGDWGEVIKEVLVNS